MIQEAASKLLENGVSTLQKTLLLKKEIEVDKVNEELQRKREEFQHRMQQSAERQVDTQKKQQKVKILVWKKIIIIYEMEITI